MSCLPGKYCMTLHWQVLDHTITCNYLTGVQVQGEAVKLFNMINLFDNSQDQYDVRMYCTVCFHHY